MLRLNGLLDRGFLVLRPTDKPQGSEDMGQAQKIKATQAHSFLCSCPSVSSFSMTSSQNFTRGHEKPGSNNVLCRNIHFCRLISVEQSG